MHIKMTRKMQLLIILGLSLLVFVCLVWEANKRNSFSDRTAQKEERNEEVQENKEQKKAEALSVDSKVRVLIMNTNFNSLFHKKIKVTSSKPFSVSIDGKKKSCRAGKVMSFSAKSKSLKGKKIILEPSRGGRLQITSVKRQNRYPSYRGTMQITWRKSGLLLTNELPLEKYLYAVVPSELSTGHKMEALKAQAVCARSYAYNQIQSNRYKKYNAHLDDSVACQVYNNIPEDRRSRKAVNATKGQVLTSKGKVVLAYYYSTSWGYSASGQDVWNTKSEIPYLKEKLQITEDAAKSQGTPALDLSSEEQFRKFIQDESVKTYDSEADWYRWKVSIPRKVLSSRVDSVLESCYQSNPKTVLTQQADGTYKKQAFRPIGKIKKIRVEKREKSGLVTQIVLVGTKNVIKVCTQYNVRRVLAPLYEQISYCHGKSSTTMSLLPSAAFYITKSGKGKNIVFCFTGGGFGHGAGMSQCGAAQMAENGKTYKDILTHYFDGAAVSPMSSLK